MKKAEKYGFIDALESFTESYLPLEKGSSERCFYRLCTEPEHVVLKLVISELKIFNSRKMVVLMLILSAEKGRNQELLVFRSPVQN